MVIRRGEIWYADLGKPRGSEPGYIRPVLVMQENHFNDSRLATVIVLAMTSNLNHAQYPGNVQILKADSGLPKDSVVNVSQIATIDKAMLDARVSALPQSSMHQIEDGLSMVLGLS